MPHCIPVLSLQTLHPPLLSCQTHGDSLHGMQVRSNAEAISILGLGTWRLKGRMDEAFAALAAQLEGAWRHHFNMELRLCPLPEVLALLAGPSWHG